MFRLSNLLSNYNIRISAQIFELTIYLSRMVICFLKRVEMIEATRDTLNY